MGYANLMATVASLARQRQLPKPRLLTQMAGIVPGLDRAASQLYLSKGGAPEYAVSVVGGCG